MTAPRPRAVPDAPPHDIEAERHILSSAIWRSSQIANVDLLPDHFYSQSCAITWAAMLELSARGVPVDTMELRMLLQDRGELDIVGGHDFLLGLTDTIPLPISDSQVQRIRRLATLRTIGERAMELAAVSRFAESDAEVSGVFQKLSAAQDALHHGERALFPSLADVIESMQFDGRRLLTALPSFDEMLRGGLPPRKFVTVLGAPGGGKTTLMTCLMDGFEQQGASCVYVASDESREGIVVRLGQLCGFGRQAMESPHDTDRRKFAAQLRARTEHLVVIDPRRDRLTIEEIARRLSRHAGNRIPVMIVDSLQTAPCAAVDPDASEYERIETTVNVLEHIAQSRGMLVIGISEMSRASYRSGSKGADTRALAGGKGAGRIEYASDLQISLTEVDPQKPGLVDVEVTKNRLTGKKNGLRIQIDDARASVREIEAPKVESPAEAAERKNRLALEQAKNRVRQAIRAHRDLKSQRDVLGVCMGARNHNATAFNQLLAADEIVQVDGVLRLKVGT